MYPNMKDREGSFFPDDLEEDQGIYSKKGREERMEENAIKSWEDAIMQGYEEDLFEAKDEEEWVADEVYREVH